MKKVMVLTYGGKMKWVDLEQSCSQDVEGCFKTMLYQSYSIEAKIAIQERLIMEGTLSYSEADQSILPDDCWKDAYSCLPIYDTDVIVIPYRQRLRFKNHVFINNNNEVIKDVTHWKPIP
jgi:hypothetical protein